LGARAAKESPELLARLAPQPPKPRSHGYGRLPRLLADGPEQPVALWNRRYSLEATSREFAADLRDAALLALRAARQPNAPLQTMVDRLDFLRQRHEFLEDLVLYHVEWQQSVADYPAYFVERNRIHGLVVEMHTLLEKGAAPERVAALRRQIVEALAPIRKTPGLAIETRGDGTRVLPVRVVTDIQDQGFLNTFRDAVHRAYGESAAAIAKRFRIELDFESIAPETLYPSGSPVTGTALDAKDHLDRFPAGRLVVTTGAARLHALPCRYIQLGTEPVQSRVLAHEFGHLLGFDDAYLRAFDGKPDDPYGCVFVEWGGLQDDLMGSPSAGSVSEAMIDQLLRAYGNDG
jgi:hypothetical protein